MTNKEIRDKGVNGMVMNGSYFVNQDFNDDFVATDTEEACDYALDYLMNTARADERERVINIIAERFATIDIPTELNYNILINFLNSLKTMHNLGD